MINWKRFCSIQYQERKYYEKLYDYENDIINMIANEFEKEDNGKKFDSSKIRDSVADYCLFLHGNDGRWKPNWKNNVSFYKRSKEFEQSLKKMQSFINPDRKKQTVINIAFVVLAIQFLGSMYIK